MENWIRIRLAQDLKISAGITTSFLENAIQELFEVERFPTKLSLICRIEQEILLLQEKWEPLKKYVRGKEKRRMALAKKLASLFIRYGVYGNKFCSEWERDPKNWQQDLWKRVFETCDYPLRSLPNLKIKKEKPQSIHLFAFSHIPALYFHFFQQLQGVHFYQLSPCQEFWSDLSNEHPLLTYFGKVGREMARLIEESNLLTEESYEAPEKETQLHRLQREMLFLEKEEKIQDDSFQLHTSFTEHEEILNLHRVLIELLQRENLEPQDIIVMAPDITRYEPYIHALFRPPLHYKISDMPARQHHPQVETLFLLFDLETRRFSAPAVYELFKHPLFLKKMGWNEDDLLQIREWMESTGIRWGLDAENRDALLKQRQCESSLSDESATWKSGIDHLLEELAVPHQPCRIEFTQAELLGEWKGIIDRLILNLTQLHQEATIREWADRLKCLHTTFFAESDILIHYLEHLARAGSPFPERRYSLEMVKALLEEVMGAKSITINGNLIQAVRFCSMLPMRAIPAKVICLIGMNHDAFPRVENLSGLDLLNQGGDYCPSRLDFDRYLFLEALLSAREKLIISYLGCDPFDQTPWPPSSAVTQLLPYLSTTVNHKPSYPLKKKRGPPSLFTYHPMRLDIPDCQIDLMDFTRCFRSPLRHYLYHQNVIVKEENGIQGEEAFHLSALKRAILRKHGLQGNDVFKKAIKEGGFPLGLFGEVSLRQLEKELESLPENSETLSVELDIGNVRLTGALEGVLPGGLCTLEKKTLQGACRAWPLFLILTALKPDSTFLLFAREGKQVNRFFDDPKPFLRRAIEYYFLSKQIPSPLFPEWIEPILHEESGKLEKAMSYDVSLRWAMRGQKPLPPNELIASWKEEAEKLYKEMADAWF